MNLNFKTLCSIAVLMYSVPAVFGMQDGKRSYPDESAEPHSKERMITVSESEGFLKTLNKPQLEEKLKSARQELKSAQQNVKNFQWLYNDALDRVLSADKRAKIITEQFGEAACSKQGIPQDKAKAEQDVKNYLELFRDAEIRKKNADTRIDTLTRIFEELGISSQANADKVIPGSYIPEPYYPDTSESCYSDSSESVVNLSIQEVRDVRMAEHNDIQSSTDNGKSPRVALYEFCQRKDTPYRLSDLKFDYVINNKGEYNCILEIGRRKFSQNTFYKNRKEATNAIAKYVLNVLKQEDSATDNKNPVIKLNEYLQDKRTKYNLSDVDYIYDMGNDGNFNCIIKILGKEYDLDLHCKSKKEAKNAIAGYVYNVLKAEAETLPQASSSGTNQQSSSVVNGNTAAGLSDSSGRRTSIASDNSDSDNSDKTMM